MVSFMEERLVFAQQVPIMIDQTIATFIIVTPHRNTQLCYIKRLQATDLEIVYIRHGVC